MNQNDLKALVGQAAVDQIESGMVVGLGSGSTVAYLIKALGQRMQKEPLKIETVTTSRQTMQLAQAVGIDCRQVDEVRQIDLTIDGADEVDADFQGIKGGGGALLWEKIVNQSSSRNIWIIDESKLVDRIGRFGVPIEVIPFGSQKLFQILADRGYHPQWRMQGEQLFETDEGNHIIDLKTGVIAHRHALARDLASTAGIVEHGLFLDAVDLVIVGRQSGVELLDAHRKS